MNFDWLKDPSLPSLQKLVTDDFLAEWRKEMAEVYATNVPPPDPDTTLDHIRIENLARALCADAGRDWDAPHTKRVRYIAHARRIIEQDKPVGFFGWLRQVFA